MNHLETQSLSTTPSRQTRWQIDPTHAAAGFRVRHLMVAHVRGLLGPVSGSAVIDEADVTRSHVEASIDVTGIDTREAKRDEHLRSADFFDVERYPTVTFRSTEVRRGKGDSLRLTGDLTIRGITKPITLEVDELPPPVKDPWGNVKRGLTARGKLNRKDYGLTWNVALEAGGMLVGENVDIEIEVELAQTKE